MKRKMTHATGAGLANAIRGRYVAAAVKDKGRILDGDVAAASRSAPHR
jgi:hypothetical protein